jgi:hypothetical protein
MIRGPEVWCGSVFRPSIACLRRFDGEGHGRTELATGDQMQLPRRPGRDLDLDPGVVPRAVVHHRHVCHDLVTPRFDLDRRFEALAGLSEHAFEETLGFPGFGDQLADIDFGTVHPQGQPAGPDAALSQDLQE